MVQREQCLSCSVGDSAQTLHMLSQHCKVTKFWTQYGCYSVGLGA